MDFRFRKKIGSVGTYAIVSYMACSENTFMCPGERTVATIHTIYHDDHTQPKEYNISVCSPLNVQTISNCTRNILTPQDIMCKSYILYPCGKTIISIFIKIYTDFMTVSYNMPTKHKFTQIQILDASAIFIILNRQAIMYKITFLHPRKGIRALYS